MPVPSFLQPYLWSYDLSTMDPWEDQRIIITQILNFTDQKAIDWVFANYPTKEIELQIKHPMRGSWSRDRLRFWLTYFDTLIDPLEFEVAIKDLNPNKMRLVRAYFNRKGLI